MRADFRADYRVIPNGVDVALFSRGRRRPELDDGRLNVLHVGRFDPRNGVDRVIKAWVAARRAGADSRLVLVGDGPLRAQHRLEVFKGAEHAFFNQTRASYNAAAAAEAWDITLQFLRTGSLD